MRARPLHLEFADQRQRIGRPGLALLAVVMLLLGTQAALLFDRLRTHAVQTEALAAADARRARATPAASPPKPADPAEVTRTRVARQVAQNLVTPWADLLESLETSPKQNVALLSVEPSVAKRTLRLTAEARTPQDMLDYLQALQRDERLGGVVLTSHQLQSQTPGQPIRFQLQASWGSRP